MTLGARLLFIFILVEKLTSRGGVGGLDRMTGRVAASDLGQCIVIA
jgi:hypothetical protein